MGNGRSRKRGGNLKSFRWPLYVPSDFREEFNAIATYASEKDLSLSFVVRNLLKTWYQVEMRRSDA
jgi:hypothetical protein